jgi:2-isopropylmalate synthase
MARPTHDRTVEIFDTTLRDGTQGEHVSLSASDKMRIARRLDAAGMDVIEGGWPGSNPKDQEFFDLAREHAWEHAEICAFGSTRRTGLTPDADPNLAAMLSAGTPTVSLFGKSWRLHANVALGVSLEENLEIIRSSVAWLKSQGRRVIYDAEHFFDGFADDGSYALETLAAALDGGADVLVLCDTNGGTLPDAVSAAVREARDRFPDVALGIHTHNDSGCAVANSLAAVAAGARHVQGTITGIGERCGNVDLCTVVPALQLKMGMDCLPGLDRLFDLAAFVSDVANLDPVDRAPYVGRSAFAHKGGIHVSAVMKDPRAYEHIDPAAVGNRRRVLVSDLSGRSNIRYKAAELGIELDDDAIAGSAVARIKELENLGYAFEAAEASFELLLRQARGEATDFFHLERMSVRTEKGGPSGEHSEASLVLVVGDVRNHVVAEGNGPVDAMSRAMRKALVGAYPALEPVRLSDYKVRVLTPEAGTAASVRVLIEHHDGVRTWSTVGVSENMISASWQALSDGARYALLLRKVAGPARAEGKAG